MASIDAMLDRLREPQPIERLELVRILAPLAILGFLSSRLVGIDHWLTTAGFVVPDLGRDDYRQPLYIPPVPSWLAWTVSCAVVVTGLATTLGLRTRVASGAFAALLAYLALADRLEAFTVNKLGTVVAVAIFLSPAGARYGVDAWRRARRGEAPPSAVSWGNVRFFQALLMVMYCASGIAKARGDWLSHSDVIWSHLHDSYQTDLTYALASSVPAFVWTAFQGVTLTYELGAPVWYGFARTRKYAVVVGLGMHAAIGLMFGPVIWFSLLMMSLIVASFAPLPRLSRMLRLLEVIVGPRMSPARGRGS
jgi:uncharacterized membrane protein YphA (DoxX/SURF4 family)